MIKFKWLTGWLKKRKRSPSRTISYFWKTTREGRIVVTGHVVGSLGLHLKVIPLGKECSGTEALVPKGFAVDRKHWQELWNEFNKERTFRWEATKKPTSIG